nr:hypothetical protein [Saccharolobus solfataricus]
MDYWIGFDLGSSLKEIDGIFILKLRNKIWFLEKFYDEERLEQLKFVLSRNWDYIIVDNYVGINEQNPIVRTVYDFSPIKIGIFLTDELSLDSTVEYSNCWNHLDSKHVLLINKSFDVNNVIDRTIIDNILNQDIPKKNEQFYYRKN